jgi:hypothetical protein
MAGHIQLQVPGSVSPLAIDGSGELPGADSRRHFLWKRLDEPAPAAREPIRLRHPNFAGQDDSGVP